MRVYLTAFSKGRNVYLNYDTETRIYTNQKISGVEYEKIGARAIQEVIRDLEIQNYRAGVFLDDNWTEIPF